MFKGYNNSDLCLPGIDDRSGSSPWGSGQQNSPSFNQGRVRFIITYYYVHSNHKISFGYRPHIWFERGVNSEIFIFFLNSVISALCLCCLSLRVMEKKAFTVSKKALLLPPCLDQELLVRRFKLSCWKIDTKAFSLS